MKRTLLILSVFLLTAFQSVMAQRTVTGVVTSADDGEPIFGANVVEEGTTNGTTTDVDGNFSLTVGDTATNLVFTYVGLQRQVVPIDTAGMNVVMRVDENVFDDVVITAIAIQREKSSLGYATTTVDNEDINRANDRSPIESLRGKVSGVNITGSSGDPGASTRIVLRGGSSILGDNQALIIVDGVPIDNSNFGAGTDINGQSDVLNNNFDAGSRGNDLNPQDIESMTVLKGPVAAARYGSRAANGAIIITTKSGSRTAKGGKPFKVSFNSNYSFSNILKLPEYQNEYGQGGEKFPDSRENFSWGPKFDGVIRPWGQAVDIDGVSQQRVKPYSALPNNVREFFDVGTTFTNNISIEGGTEKSLYYLSYNNFKNNGVIPGTGYDRNSLRFNASHNFTDKLSSSITFSYVKTMGDLVMQGQDDYSVYDQILQTPRDISLLELEDLNDPFNQPETYYGAYTLNPWWVLQNQEVTNNVDRFNTTASLSYKPAKWLDFTGRFGTDIYTDTRQVKLAKYSFINQDFLNENVGKYSEDIYRSNIYNSDIIVSANHTFDFGLGINALVGNNIYSESLKNTYAATAGLNIEDFYNLSNSAGRPVVRNVLNERRTIGVYGELGFDWKKFIYLTFTARNDWASTLPENDRSYFYPSINGAFVLTEVVEINPKIISYMKIRGGFSKVGSGGEEPYLLQNVFVPALVEDGYVDSEIQQPYPSGDEQAGAYSTDDVLRNPNLRPETVRAWEVGTEIAFWNDRLSVDFTYYHSESKDLILSTSEIAPSSGHRNQVLNAGSQVNKGVELAVNFIPVSTKKGFKWEIYGTFTKNKNEVTDLPEGIDQIVLGGLSDLAIVAREGEPYGAFYGITARRDPQGRVIVDTSGSSLGQPILNQEPQILGSYQPDWMGSLGTSISYKGLKFSILFDTRQGGKIWSRTMDVQEFVGSSPNTLNNDREDFIVPNSVYEVSDGSGVQYVENDRFLAHHQDYWTIYNNEDRGAHLLPATFTKLREVSLSYSLPAKLMKKTKYIAGVEFRVYGTNLALWTPKENTFIDPETSSYGAGNAQGFEYGTTPSLRQWGFGFKLDF